MENRSFEWKLEDIWLVVKVRFSIFIIIGACAGLPALVWSVRDLIHHRKNGHSISIFIILLLLTDFVELFLSPYILFTIFLNENPSCEDWTCWVFSSLWWSSRVCGILLNQMVALEGVLSVKYPRNTACVFSSPCFIILYIAVLIYVFICTFISHPSCFPSVLVVSVITWILSCGLSCSAERLSHTTRKPDYHILAVFIYTLLVFYILMVLNLFLMLFFPFIISTLFIPYFLTSMRLISDPLLCVLVCRQNIRVQTSEEIL